VHPLEVLLGAEAGGKPARPDHPLGHAPHGRLDRRLRRPLVGCGVHAPGQAHADLVRRPRVCGQVGLGPQGLHLVGPALAAEGGAVQQQAGPEAADVPGTVPAESGLPEPPGQARRRGLQAQVRARDRLAGERAGQGGHARRVVLAPTVDVLAERGEHRRVGAAPDAEL
jgi:hypothetical protein